ncbi:MAG: phosphoribosyl-ATP diphosphatase [Clostridia bacterium]|nr:phosphoribosyl-ATP diphosphatase [Clostridia bacterium]MBQ7728497.1 phosphoribosyl-ATP diphosphatase [Clostridia bacterium]
MKNETMEQLYAVVKDRQVHPAEGSYTCYLFEQGLDKILKKVGEESAETIIAAKNDDNSLLCGEICDLLYHLTVLCAEKDLDIRDVMGELDRRSEKIGNLKQMKKVDRNT